MSAISGCSLRCLAAVVLMLAVSTAGADLVVDGVNNFSASDTYATSSSGYTGYASLGPSSLNFGLTGPDVASSSSTNWYVAYIAAGGAGTSTGLTFNTQQPNLPFSATHFIQWRPSDGFTLVKEYDGSSWVNSSGSWQVASSGQFVEVGAPLSLLGSPTTVQLAAYMLNEQVFNEWSYAAMPGDTFTDGYDKNLATSLTLSSIPEPSVAMAGCVLTMGFFGARSRRR